MTESIGIAVTAVLTLAGLYFGNSLRLKTRTEVEASVAEKRFAAYAALWAQTKIASPMRLVPLTRAERSQLYDKLTDWYYDDGNGMLLTPATRNIYLKAKKNLTCPPEELVPESLVEQAAHDDGDTVRGQASIDQLSLLRTSMRADIRIYTQPYDEELSTEDIAFLEASNVDVHRDPWRGTRASGSPCITTRSSKSFCWAGERPTSSAAEEAHGGLFGFYLEKIPLSPQKIDEVM